VLRWLPADPGLLPPAQRLRAPSPWRCGVVVSTKVHKRAVCRNRLRRELHAAVLAQLPCEPAPPQWLLVSLKPGSASWEIPRLLGECRHLLEKAGLKR
jgi:ribonuclease P protein component